MTQLYKLANELAVINDTIIDAEGEISPELEGKLNTVAMEFQEKALSIGKWTLDISSNETALDNEIKRLQRKKQVMGNLRERLVTYVKHHMEIVHKSKIESPIITIAIHKNPPSVEVYDEKKLPAKFIKIKQVTEIDKAELAIILKRGEEVEGARLITDKTHLRIK